MRLIKFVKKLAEDEKYLVTKKGTIICEINKETGETYYIEIRKKPKH